MASVRKSCLGRGFWMNLLLLPLALMLLSSGCTSPKKRLSYAEQMKLKKEQYSAMSEEEQIAAIQEQWWRIQFIDKPSLKVQETAIAISPSAIEQIQNPSTQVQIMAIDGIMKEGSFNKALTKLINDFSDDAQIAAIKHNVQIIKFITYPSPRVQLEAVKINPFVVKNIINATEEAKQEAIRRNPKVKKYLR